MVPGRPSVLRSAPFGVGRSTSGRVRKDPRALPSKVRISSGSRRASLPRLSPPVVPPSPAPDGSGSGVGSSSDRSESSAASCHRSPGGPRFDPHVPCSPKRSGSWVVRAIPFPSWVAFLPLAAVTPAGRRSERARVGPSETWRVPRSPVARCPWAVRIGVADLPSFRVRGATLRCHPFRGVSGCGPPLLVPHTTGKFPSRPARNGPCSLDLSRNLFGAELSGSFCRPCGRPGVRSLRPPSEFSRAGSTSAAVVSDVRPESLDSDRSAVRGALVIRWISGP